MNSKQLKRQLVGAICSVFMAAAALGSSTYAWYVNNAQVTATSVSVTSTTSYSLLIKRAVSDSVYSSTTALNGGTTLVPVSTLGERKTSSGTLYDNPDGTSRENSYDKNDIIFVRSNEWDGSGRVKNFTEVGKNTLTLINDGINTPYYSTLYYSDSVYLKAGQNSKIYFDDNSTGIYTGTYDDDNSAKPGTTADNNLTPFTSFAYQQILSTMTEEEKSAAERNNQIVALLKTMRVGLLVTQYEGTSEETTNFYVYQFLDEEIDSANTYTTTIDMSTGITVDGITYAAGSSGVNKLETNVCNLVTVDGVREVPLLSNCLAKGRSDGLAVVYNDAATGKVSQSIATVNANEEIKVDIYFWMEGCDLDNTAGNSELFSTEIQGIQFGFCLGLPE